MYSAELNVPQNHVYLFKPHPKFLIFSVRSFLYVGGEYDIIGGVPMRNV